MKRLSIGTLLVAASLFAAAFGAGFAIYLRPVDASRNSSGTYSLPTPGVPFQSNQTISSTQVNNTLNDIATALTDSKSKSGLGDFTAAVRGVDGTVAAPAYSWTSETGSGLFRNAASDVRMAIAGALAEQWTAAAVLPALPLRAASGLVSAPSLSFASDTGSGLYRIGSNDIGFALNGTKLIELTANLHEVSGGAHLLSNATPYAVAGKGEELGYDSVNDRAFIQSYDRTGAAWKALAIDALTVTMNANSSGTAVAAGAGLKIGSSGTTMSASYRGTVSWTPGNLGPGICATTTITVTGASAGTECAAGPPSAPADALFFFCYVTANTCTLKWCYAGATNATPPSGTYACRASNG